jgi:hypothetical protein
MVAADSDYLTVAAPSDVPPSLRTNFDIPEPDYAQLAVSDQVQAEKARLAAEAKARAEARQSQIDKVTSYLQRKKSPMVPYAAVIVDAATRCGGDFKTLLAIAEVESGLGRQPYKKYNPYGYLNGVQYPDWSTALDRLSCAISKQYSAVYGTDFAAMGKKYAASTTWPAKVSRIYYSI